MKSMKWKMITLAGLCLLNGCDTITRHVATCIPPDTDGCAFTYGEEKRDGVYRGRVFEQVPDDRLTPLFSR